MNAIQLNSRGGPDALAYGPAAVPRPGAGEILVRVRAAAVTPTELLWVTTWTTRAGEPRPLPIIPGHEFSGEVHGVGAAKQEKFAEVFLLEITGFARETAAASQ